MGATLRCARACGSKESESFLLIFRGPKGPLFHRPCAMNRGREEGQAPAGVLPPHRAKRTAGTPVPVPHEQTQPGAAVVQIFYHPSAMNRGREGQDGWPTHSPSRSVLHDEGEDCAAPPGLTSLFLLTQGLRPGLPSRRASPPQQAKPGLAGDPASGAVFGSLLLPGSP